MRKLFRMKYESCSGRCYAPGDVVDLPKFDFDVKGAAEFLHRLLEIHEPACGNENLGYALDFDDELRVFVASFQRYGALDLFCGKTPLEAIDKMIDAALAYYKSDEYKIKAAVTPGLGHDVCEHGEDRDLIDFALMHSNLPTDEQMALRGVVMQSMP